MSTYYAPSVQCMSAGCSAGHSEGVHRLMQGGAPRLAAQGAGHPSCPRPCAEPHPLHPGFPAQPAPCLLPRLSPGGSSGPPAIHALQTRRILCVYMAVEKHVHCMCHVSAVYILRVECMFTAYAQPDMCKSKQLCKQLWKRLCTA